MSFGSPTPTPRAGGFVHGMPKEYEGSEMSSCRLRLSCALSSGPKQSLVSGQELAKTCQISCSLWQTIALSFSFSIVIELISAHKEAVIQMTDWLIDLCHILKILAWIASSSLQWYFYTVITWGPNGVGSVVGENLPELLMALADYLTLSLSLSPSLHRNWTRKRSQRSGGRPTDWSIDWFVAHSENLGMNRVQFTAMIFHLINGAAGEDIGASQGLSEKSVSVSFHCFMTWIQ